MNWLQSVLYGFLSGAADILPVSSRAHGILLLKIFGTTVDGNFMLLFLHTAVTLALYFSCRTQLIRIRRALALARVPKKKRRRPLDTKSLMDFRLLRTTAIPIILAYVFYDKVFFLGGSLLAVAGFLFLNGLILYIPQFLPTGNKDARSMSRVDGLLIGLGGALSVFPGISAIGAMVSVSSVLGVDQEYGTNNALITGILISACISINDLVRMIGAGLSGVTFGIVLVCLATGLAAFAGTFLGIRLLRAARKSIGLSIFTFYCWGLARCLFLLNLIA